ncbi:hypothetical protein HR17_04070 [Porphyromonas gulae]|nr:hypothetical protein [Porphyromonas gulae]KGN75401.1 hypothetical protein HR17_04070 [Porphyromonas gulae]
MRKTENTGIYIIRFARVREKKGLKEEENEKKKISCAKKNFQPPKGRRLKKGEDIEAARHRQKAKMPKWREPKTQAEKCPNLKPKSTKNGARFFSVRREIFSTPAPKQKYSQTTFYSPKYTEFFKPKWK